MPGQVRRASTPCCRSERTVRDTRATRECPWPGCVRTQSATVPASTTSVAATSGAAWCTGEGSARSTTTVIATWTTWPAARSHATARIPPLRSPASRPWLTPRCTSPTTPPGSAVLSSCER